MVAKRGMAISVYRLSVFPLINPDGVHFTCQPPESRIFQMEQNVYKNTLTIYSSRF